MPERISDLDQVVQDFLTEPRFGVLATLRPDGSAQQTVMWWKRNGDKIMMNTLSGRAKDRYMEANHWVSLCVEEGQQYVTLEGQVSIDRDGDLGQRTIRELAWHYGGDEVSEEALASDYGSQERVTIYLTPTSIDARGFDE